MASTMNITGKTRRKPKLNIALQIFLFAWALIQIFPLYWLLTFSLKDNNEIFSGNLIGLPKEWRFENYKIAFIDGKVGRYFFNSVFVTVTTIILVSLFAIMASYALVRMKWRMRGFVQAMFIMGITIPLHAVLLPVFIILRTVKLVNSYFALIIPYTTFVLPMAIMICSSLLSSIPAELEEAACIDGSSIYNTFFRIVVPLMKPAIATVAIFTFLQSWNELMFAVVFISDPKYKTLTVGIQSLVGEFAVDWGPIGAALVVATFPTIISYLVLSRQVQRSLVLGAIKG
jgi:raffinose/stachyose/melibiose transport system permease protein